jgi:hypothetical protein
MGEARNPYKILLRKFLKDQSDRRKRTRSGLYGMAGYVPTSLELAYERAPFW